jgi:hypothetical protein
VTRSASPVDVALAAHASTHGRPTDARQVERWRQVGLLPPNERRSTGRGSTSTSPEGALELVVWLSQNARRGRRPLDLALQAFGQGLLVPEATVRKAFAAAIERAHLKLEREFPENSPAEDVAETAVRLGLAATMLPARVRAIDHALIGHGLNELPPEIHALDAGAQGEPITPADWTFNTVLAMRAGGGVLTVEQLGDMARSVIPPELAAPFAAEMERHWPDNEAERAVLLNDSGGLTQFPEGDIRDLLTSRLDTLTLGELRSGWRAAAQLSQWCTELCTTVEAEIAAGDPGPASLEWITGAIAGTGRMLLTVGLRDSGARPADLAFTALLLLWMRDCIQTARDLLPQGEFDHLRLPGVLPPPFLQLLVDARILGAEL